MSRLEPRSPQPYLLQAPSPSVPSQEPDSSHSPVSSTTWLFKYWPLWVWVLTPSSRSSSSTARAQDSQAAASISPWYAETAPVKRSSQQPVRLLGPPRVLPAPLPASNPETRGSSGWRARAWLRRRGLPSDTWWWTCRLARLWWLLTGSVSELCAFYPGVTNPDLVVSPPNSLLYILLARPVIDVVGWLRSRHFWLVSLSCCEDSKWRREEKGTTEDRLNGLEFE